MRHRGLAAIWVPWEGDAKKTDGQEIYRGAACKGQREGAGRDREPSSHNAVLTPEKGEGEGRKEWGLVRRRLRLQCSFEKGSVGLMWGRVPHGKEIFWLSDPYHEYSHCSGALGESRVSAWMLQQIHWRCNTCRLPGDYPHCSREIRIVCLCGQHWCLALAQAIQSDSIPPGSPFWAEVCDMLGPKRHMEKSTAAHVGKMFFPFPLSGRDL